MAITSVGYDGQINELQWAALAPTMGAEYGAVGAGHWRVSVVSGADRTVKVAVGSGFGNGVYDTSDAEVTIQCDSIVSGTRWDLIVARRNWSGAGGATTFTKVTGTSVQTAVFALRNQSPGTLDDQPLALVQITAGQTIPTQVIDLRVWQANGGAAAQDALALQYLTAPGTEVWIGTDVWHRSVDSSSGSAAWSRSSMSSVPLLSLGGGALSGTPTSSSDFKIQTGTTVVATNFAGFVFLSFPTAFPNGLLSVMLQNGDDGMGNDVSYHVAGSAGGGGIGTRGTVVYRVWGPNGGGPGTYARVPLLNFYHRVNWLAVGW